MRCSTNLRAEVGVAPDTRATLGDVADRHRRPSRRAAPCHRRRADRCARASLAANAWYCPDTARATAGIHFLRVLRDLGLDGEVADRIRAYPSGAIAMQALAQSALPARSVARR